MSCQSASLPRNLSSSDFLLGSFWFIFLSVPLCLHLGWKKFIRHFQTIKTASVTQWNGKSEQSRPTFLQSQLSPAKQHINEIPVSIKSQTKMSCIPWMQIQTALPGDETVGRAGLRGPAFIKSLRMHHFPWDKGSESRTAVLTSQLNQTKVLLPPTLHFEPAQWLVPIQLCALCTLQIKLRGLRGSWEILNEN